MRRYRPGWLVLNLPLPQQQAVEEGLAQVRVPRQERVRVPQLAVEAEVLARVPGQERVQVPQQAAHQTWNQYRPGSGARLPQLVPMQARGLRRRVQVQALPLPLPLRQLLPLGRALGWELVWGLAQVLPRLAQAQLLVREQVPLQVQA